MDHRVESDIDMWPTELPMTLFDLQGHLSDFI